MLVVVLTLLRLALVPYLKKTAPHLRTGAYPVAKFFNELLDAVVYAAVFVFMVIRPFGVQAFLIPSGSMWSTLYVNDFIVANKAVYRYSNPKAGDIVVFRPPKDAVFGPRLAEDLDAEGNVKVDYIKRCIGTPGDVVELKKGQLYRNGQKVAETYTHYSDTQDGVTFNEIAPGDFQPELPSFKLVVMPGSKTPIPLNYTDFDANAASPQSMTMRQPYGVIDKFQISDPATMEMAKKLPPAKIPAGYYLMMGDNRNNSSDGRVWGLVPRDQIIGRSEFIWLPFNRIGKTR